MKITLSLNWYQRFISTDPGITNNFIANDIDEAGYKNGYIDIFDVLLKLQGKGFLPDIIEDSLLELIPGENRCIIIGNNENFKKITTVSIQGYGKRTQVIKINGFNGEVNITHCKPLDTLIAENRFGRISIQNDLEIYKVNILGKGDSLIGRNLKIITELLVNGVTLKNDFLLENVAFLSDANDSAKFSIYGSTIGKLSIKNLELPKDGLTISNSKILEAFFYKVNLERLKLIGVIGRGFGNLIKGENESSEMKEFYRQLKHSHDEIGNKTEANKFFAKEMEYYEKSLSGSEWDKKIVSFVQRYSNNYGNSWLRPFIWIIIVSFLYTYLSDCWDFKCTCGGVQDWHCFQSHWLKNVSQFPTELKNAKDWWFLLYAIIMGSLFYQLLVALRRISQR